MKSWTSCWRQDSISGDSLLPGNLLVCDRVDRIRRVANWLVRVGHLYTLLKIRGGWMIGTVKRSLEFSLAVLAVLACGIFLVTLAASPAAAQGNQIHGVVQDSSGASVANAQVAFRNDSYSATTSTDQSGAFTFNNVPVDSGTLTFTADGMKQVEQQWASSSNAPVQVVLEPLSLNQRVLVTATRSENSVGDTPISDVQLTSDDVRSSPALTLDDVLHQIPGFSLFRRTSSRTANPTTMGVSLRGLGASGASRALVLEDGIPLNDPFGSWVYWGRVPRASVTNIEVAQEGASSLYGSDALGGVVQFDTRPPSPSGLSIETSFGNQNTQDVSLAASTQLKGWYAILAGEAFHTDGYYLVPGPFRGTVDSLAGTQHATGDLTIGRKIGAHSDVFARGWYLDDERNNGTIGQNNDIRLAQGALGADLDGGSAGTFTLRFYGNVETYHQKFFSVAFNQNSQALTDAQTVPAQGVGGSAVWSRNLGHRQTLVAGFDEHEEIGHSNENIFSSTTGAGLRDTFVGGRQRTTGLFGEDLIQIAPGWVLSVSARYDHWSNFDASSLCTPLVSTCPANVFFPTRTYDAFSPRATLLHQFDSHVSWSASVYRAFRAPSLNELYRGFRQANNQTSANPDLTAEHLTGGETGLAVNGFDRRVQLRGTFFYNQMVNPVATVSCAVPNPSPFCAAPTAGTNEFVRANLGRTSAPGVEVSVVGQVTSRFTLSGGYQYVDAKVVAAPGQPQLLYTWVQQVPHNALTFMAQYSNPSFLSFSIEGDMIGLEYDTNLLPLDRYFVLNAMVSRHLGRGIEVFASAENVFDTTYISTAGTSVSPPQIGLPVAVYCGFRFDFPHR